MGQLIYATPMSLDGYIAEGPDNLDWSAPDDEGLTAINDLFRPVGLYLYGRKMYETMAVWETPEVIPGLTSAMREFGRIWQSADKIVYSRSLDAASTSKTRIDREFDPQAIRDLKVQSPHDISIGGPTLAADAIRAGLVDAYCLFVGPAMIGGGKCVLPGNVAAKLNLVDERRFADGTVHLHYRTRV
jgi:dihydrofolate reductase